MRATHGPCYLPLSKGLYQRSQQALGSHDSANRGLGKSAPSWHVELALSLFVCAKLRNEGKVLFLQLHLTSQQREKGGGHCCMGWCGWVGGEYIGRILAE